MFACCPAAASAEQVYGGSTLDVMRGGFDTLLGAGLTQPRYDAVELARAYDAAAFAAYPAALGCM